MGKVRFLLASSILLAVAPLAGCSGESFSQDGPTETGATYHRDVEPIVQRSCQGCHAPGRIAPFSLLTFEDARAVAGLMADQAEARTMPPWGAQESEECAPRFAWKHDLRLSDDEIATLREWASSGAPEGDPADAPGPKEPPVDGLPGVETTLLPSSPYVTSGDQDQFRCFVMDPGLDAVSYLNGVHVVAGNTEVVHHAVVVADPHRASEAMADASGGYDCFGGFGDIPDVQLLHVWAPGGVPMELPSNIGVPLLPGSLMVMQIHYHPAGAAADPDTTRVELRFTDAKPDYFLAAATPIGNYAIGMPGGDGIQPGPNDAGFAPHFRVPANVSGHTEEMQLTLPQTGADGAPLPKIWVYGAAAHMHYVGTEMSIELEHASPEADVPGRECLLNEPRWDFDWQRFYTYDAPIEQLPVIGPGDRLKLRCTYDNTLDNPGVARALHDAKEPQPKDVFLGEQTLDEMCLVMLPLLYEAPF